LLCVQEILNVVLSLLDDGVTVFNVSVCGLCWLSQFLIYQPQIMLGYAVMLKRYELVHNVLDPPLDVMF